MSKAAHLFIDTVIAAGAFVLLASILYWQCENPVAYAAFVILAVAGSALKVDLPGISGTYSIAFCFVLIAIFTFNIPETAMLGAMSAGGQCLYRPKRRPALRPVLFSMAGVAISAVTAEMLYRAALAMAPAGMEACAVMLPATAYWFINTGLVSAALWITGEGTIGAIWQRWCLSTLPYYFVGAVVTIPASSAVRTSNWTVTLLVLPPLALLYIWWRLFIRTAAERERAPAN